MSASNFIFHSGHLFICLVYNTNEIPNHFTFAVKGDISYVTLVTVIVSHVKILCTFSRVKTSCIFLCKSFTGISLILLLYIFLVLQTAANTLKVKWTFRQCGGQLNSLVRIAGLGGEILIPKHRIIAICNNKTQPGRPIQLNSPCLFS